MAGAVEQISAFRTNGLQFRSPALPSFKYLCNHFPPVCLVETVDFEEMFPWSGSGSTELIIEDRESFRSFLRLTPESFTLLVEIFGLSIRSKTPLCRLGIVCQGQTSSSFSTDHDVVLLVPTIFVYKHCIS